MLKLIGLAGKARTGKDTVASYLQSKYGFYTTSFAEPLKSGLMLMLGLDVEHIDGDKKEEIIPEYGRSPRHMMQTLGTDWGRNMIAPDLWVKAMGRRLDALDHVAGVVITDVRFEDEAYMVRERGGVIMHIERPDATDVLSHASEGGIQQRPGDLVINNIGTIDELTHKINDALLTIQRMAA